MSKLSNNKKIGLALGGGAVLGAAHIGVLKAMDELKIPVHFIAGTSIGAFVAAFHAFGKSWNEIQEIALQLDWLEISAMTLSRFGLLSNEKIASLISENIGKKKIEDAGLALAIVATDITNGEKVVLNKGPVTGAVMASTCIPGIFVPVEMGDRLLVDGGIVENVPVSVVNDMGADFTIAVDLNANYRHKRPENIIEVLLNTFDFTFMTATKMQTAEADLLIKPDLTEFNMIDTDQVDSLIEAGYSAARTCLNEFDYEK